MAAIATAPGQGGVGIVRISGSQAPVIAERIAGKLAHERVATVCDFVDAEGELIDQGLQLYFADGHSFTGEAVVELQGHGGPIVLQRLLETALAHGARLALPGEFSERAFTNGRMDLAQAEAVLDLISSGSVAAARGAARSLRGEFSATVNAIADELRTLRVYVEADIDFPDEDVDVMADDAVRGRIAAITEQIQTLRKRCRQGVLLAQGVQVALVGAPNAGKSSLLNRLSGEETAIVTNLPGTTRDLLKVDLVLQGLPVRIIDTAGLRETQDPVEAEGVRRAIAALADADLVIYVRDGAQPEDSVVPTEWLAQAAKVLEVFTKLDLVTDRANEGLWVSNTTGERTERLVEAIVGEIGFHTDASAFTARQRHIEALDLAERWLVSASSAFVAGAGSEVVAEELRLGHDALGSIVGRVTSDQLLGDIFSSFCIGK